MTYSVDQARANTTISNLLHKCITI